MNIKVATFTVREKSINTHAYFLFQLCMFSCGGRIGFFRGDPKLLVEDLQALKPTVLPMVPRLLNRVYDKVSMH